MTHVREELGAYLLGALAPEEERRVRAHLETCADCAAAHAELAALPRLLDLAVTTAATEKEPLPPAIEERLLDRFARERVERPQRARWRPRLAIGGASALVGAGVAVALLIFGFGYEHNAARPTSQYQVAFERLAAAPANASARAGLRTSESGTVLRLWVNNLPPGDVYEVWCDAPGWSASAGTFRVDAKGDAYVVLTAAVQKGEYTRVRVVRRAHLAGGQVVPSDILYAKLA